MSTPKIKLNGSWVPLVTIPTTVSSFSNDAGYITLSLVPVLSVNGLTGAVSLSIPSNISDLTNDSDFIESDTVTKIYTQSSAPSSAVNGDIWLDTSVSLLKLKQNDTWVSYGGDTSGFVSSETTATLTVSDTEPSNPSIGDVWIDSSGDTIPMANGVDF